MGKPTININRLKMTYQYKDDVREYTEEDFYLLLKYRLYNQNTPFIILHNIYYMLMDYINYHIQMENKGKISWGDYNDRYIEQHYLENSGYTYKPVKLESADTPVGIYKLPTEDLEHFYRVYLGGLLEEYKYKYKNKEDYSVVAVKYPKYWYYFEMFDLHGVMSFYLGEMIAENLLTEFDKGFFKWLNTVDYKELGESETDASLRERVREFTEGKPRKYLNKNTLLK